MLLTVILLIAVLMLGFRIYTEHRFRFAGYNAPEVRGPEREMGLIAKRYLQQILYPGKEITIQTIKADSFGRYLCYVFLEAETFDGQYALQDKLIKAGYGVYWDGKGKRPKFNPEQPYPLIGDTTA